MQDFEERLKRLEEIGERLRSGELSIDDATKLFEEGVGLSRKLEEELQQMERRIEMLTTPTEDPEAPPGFEPFESGEDR
ncbi:MAG: exodeoxyribonuclease VII small subunit [Alkalispirochaeta sp.]